MDTNVVDVCAFSRLPQALPLASTCQRLRHIFFNSVNTIDCTIPHTSHALPPHYHSKFCTTCPFIVPLPAFMLLVQRSYATLRTIRLPKLDIESTILIISTVAESCLQLRELSFTDKGAINAPLAIVLLSSRNLTSLAVYEPFGSLLEALCTSSASLQNVSLVSVSISHGTLITRFLGQNASDLRSLSIAFFNERRFLAEPFAFPRHNLHLVYPNMHLDLPSPIASVLAFIASNRLNKLPLLSELAITTLGADLNQEGCDLINCPSPFLGLDALCGTVLLIRRSSNDRCATHPLKRITLRTDHLVLHASVHALAELLSSRVNFTLQVNQLTLDIPPVSSNALQMSKLTSSDLTNAISYATKTEGLLNHSVRSVCLESLLNSDFKVSHRSDFSKLHTVDVGSGRFYVKYGRDPEAFRPRLVDFLRRAESSLHTVRISGAIRDFHERHSASLVYDVLSHTPNVKTLELSDDFLVMARHQGCLTEMFIHLGKVETIRFGSLSWVSYPSVGIYTARVAEFFSMLVALFTTIGRSCPRLKHLVMFSTYHSCWSARGRERLALRLALQALEDLEKKIPNAETGTVHAQIRLWMKTRNSP